MTDYIIVGCGLGGIALAETAIQRGKTVVVFDNDSQSSSRVAGGLYNPVILKRFSKLANAQQQLLDLQAFYTAVEARLHTQFYYPTPILRKFHSVEEQNNWFEASDKPGLSEFLSTQIVNRIYKGIDSPFGYGEVMRTGYVDVAALLTAYRAFLQKRNSYINEAFDYSQLAMGDTIKYRQYYAKHIIFAEGYGIHGNPYFSYLPLDGTKGELFIIKAPGLDLDVIINASVFILPLGNDLYKVGATYHWTDKTDTPTAEGREELLQKIREVVNCDFEIVEHLAGVRPTVKDRKPLLGTHPEFQNMHVFNGLGTRGVMLGPYMAKELLGNMECGTEIARENDIKRFIRAYPMKDHNS